MKIDAQIAMLNTMIEPNKYEQDTCFEHVLDSPGKERQDDDYYWQHQSQLQQSALTFNPLVGKASHPEITSFDKAIVKSPALVATDIEQQLTHLCIIMDNYVPMSTTIAELGIEQLIDGISTTLNPTGRHAEAEITDQAVVNKYSKQPISNQPLLQSTLLSFKNHQLFLSDNALELTLNTTHLSKQQASELQKLIKQWLTQKGYTLKQLMINGVQQ